MKLPTASVKNVFSSTHIYRSMLTKQTAEKVRNVDKKPRKLKISTI